MVLETQKAAIITKLCLFKGGIYLYERNFQYKINFDKCIPTETN